MTRKILLIATTSVAAVALANWAYSQTAPSSQPCHGGKFMERMTEKLNLTPDQQSKVRDILQQARADAANAPDPQAKHEVFKAAFTRIRTDVLNDQQRAEFQQMKRHWHHGHHKMMGYRALNLTPEQQAQVKAIWQQAKADAANAPGKQARHTVFRAAKEKIDATVLTPEQRDQLAQMRAACKHHHGHHAPSSQPAGTGQ